MKKSILIIALGITVISCRKVQVCTCQTSSDLQGFTTQTKIVNTGKMTRKQASTGPCASYSEKINGSMYYTYCKID